MKQTVDRLRHVARESCSKLRDATATLRAIVQTDGREMPENARKSLETALASIEQANHALYRACVGEAPESAPPTESGSDAPTRQQGQFLAYIQQFISLNPAGLAPSHAELQKFFDLTPPSVNSMLIRLEQRGFIRRIPSVARAIELTLAPEQIPPLERRIRK